MSAPAGHTRAFSSEAPKTSPRAAGGAVVYPAADPDAAPACAAVACGEARRVAGHSARHAELLRADRLALSLAAALDQVTPALARAAVPFVRRRVRFEFGFARLEDYARERLGRSGRWLRELALLGDAFARLPLLVPALAGAGGGTKITKVAALAVARVATPESTAAWLAAARRTTVRELRALVRRAIESGSAWPEEEETPAREAGSASAARRPDAPEGGELGAEEEDDEARRLVRYLVPEPVLAAFEEGLELFRAVVGSQDSVTSFVEALVGEELSGPSPPI